MGSLSKSEFADYIWNNGILPLLSNARIQNRSGAYVLSDYEVANRSWQQTKGGWGASWNGVYVKGPCGFEGKEDHDRMYDGQGYNIRACTDAFSNYWLTSNVIGDEAPIGCTIYGGTGPGSNGSYGPTSYTARLYISTGTYPAVNATTAYTAYINYLTALGLFDTGYSLGSSRSYALFLMGATAFWVNSLLIIPWSTNYVFVPASSSGVVAYPANLLADIDSDPTLSSSSITALFTKLVSAFNDRQFVKVTSARISGVPATTTCSSSSSSSCSSSSSSSSCSSSSCSSSSCSSSCSSSIFIAYYNIGGAI